MDNPDLYDKAKDEFEILIEKVHRAGLIYWQIHGLLLDLNKQVYKQAEAEYQSKVR